jgi:hypothetical protein
MLMTILAIILILCHISNLICNLLRDRSIPEVVIPILGVILSTLMFFPSILEWGFSFSFFCFPLMIFFNVFNGLKHQNNLDTKDTKSDLQYVILQYVIYGVSGLGIISSLILGVIWSYI